jgi:hypothetical protein
MTASHNSHSTSQSVYLSHTFRRQATVASSACHSFVMRQHNLVENLWARRNALAQQLNLHAGKTTTNQLKPTLELMFGFCC